MVTIPGIENINWYGAVGSLLYWIKWGFYSIIMLVGFYIVYIFMTYNISVSVFPLYGSSKDGVFSVQKPKWNRVKWNKQKSAWKTLLPFFSRKEREPFDSEYIYPGNKIYAFELNNEWIPGRVNVTQTEKKIRAEINPVPYYIRNWQSLERKKNEIEYAMHSWWDDNKTLVFALMGAIAILAAGLIFIYMSYKMAGAGRADISALTNAINNWGNIGGVAPQ